jgi:hypothetical protein
LVRKVLYELITQMNHSGPEIDFSEADGCQNPESSVGGFLSRPLKHRIHEAG